MIFAVVSVIIGFLLAGGAVQEVYVRGVQGGELQPLIHGSLSLLTTLVLVIAALALWRRWPHARRFVIWAAAICLVVHAYSALPPHRNVGIGAVLIAVIWCSAGFLVARRARA